MELLTSRGKRAIEDHFDNAFEPEFQLRVTSQEYHLQEIKDVIERVTFTYVCQQQLLELGHSVLVGEPLIIMLKSRA